MDTLRKLSAFKSNERNQQDGINQRRIVIMSPLL
jgi:hypothetical protein